MLIHSFQKAQFEIVARNEYTRSDMKNPVDCSLYYLALKKKVVLQGLWRMATWNREQTATTKLLSNNFQEPKWQTTALKNAYALMSKRRFGKPACLFLTRPHWTKTRYRVRCCLFSAGRPSTGRCQCLSQPDEGPPARYCDCARPWW